ncbi:CYTH domain-containing protein, partial [Meloidogyne graminicola]
MDKNLINNKTTITKSFLPLFSFEKTKRYLNIKIKINDIEEIEWKLFSLTDSLGLVTKSEEIFYRVPKGQLKICFEHPGKNIGELISISPTDNKSFGKLFYLLESRISTLPEAGQFRHTLNLCLEELAIIRKKRKSYIFGSIKFYLDNIECLGDYYLDIEIYPEEEEK